MVFIAIIIGCCIGAIVGNFAPIIPYTYSGYLAIGIVAALDSVFGGVLSHINKKFDMGVFVTGFFGNAILAIALAYLGQRLNVDIYLVTIFVFVSRMFNNLGFIRRHYLEKFRNNGINKTKSTGKHGTKEVKRTKKTVETKIEDKEDNKEEKTEAENNK